MTSSNRDYRYFAISLVLHIVSFVGLLIYQIAPSGGLKLPRFQEKQVQNIIEKNDVQETIDISIIDGSVELPKEDKNEKQCKNDLWYGGVGVHHDYFTSKLTEVFKDYPAYNSGLQVGDIVLDRNLELRGDPGTLVVVVIKRGEKVMTFNVIRGKICYEEEENP